MGISDEINLVEREFVAGHTLVEALMIQEKATEFHVASWFLRNIEELYSLQMIEFNRELRDFTIVEDSWANDIFATIVVDKVPSPEWTNLGDGYVGGWLSLSTCSSRRLRKFLTRNLISIAFTLV